MIQLLPEPLDGEDVQTGLPLIILGLKTEATGVWAIAVGDEGEARLIPWNAESLKIPWRFDHGRSEWVDEGPLVAMSKAKASADPELEP